MELQRTLSTALAPADEADEPAALPAPVATPTVQPVDVMSAAPDLAMGVTYLVTWIAPEAIRPAMVSWLTGVMVLEFIIIHSSAFMGTVMFGKADRRGKAITLLGLGGFYTLFVGGFSLAFKTWWPLVSFWGLTVNRILGVLIGQVPRGEEREFIQRNWAVSALGYMVFTFATVLLPVPRLGITREVVARQHLPGSGLWVDQPHRVIACGFLYFTVLGLSELVRHRWMAGTQGVGGAKAGTPAGR